MSTRTLLVLVICGAGFLLVRYLWQGREPAPDDPGVSMRQIVNSQESYFATAGEGTYAPSLATLLEAGLIDAELGSGSKGGYVFSVSAGDGETTFTATARPVQFGSTGRRSFHADQTGVVRYTTEDRPATDRDDPLGY